MSSIPHLGTEFAELELNGGDISDKTFPLPPPLQGRLRHAAVEIHEGRGFCVVRGLGAARYSDADNLLIFLGLASYIGDTRGVQDRRGNVICMSGGPRLPWAPTQSKLRTERTAHITSAKTWTTPPEQRHRIHTNKALVCLSRSAAGDISL